MATGEGTARPFTILTVCTGNICRSPLAAQLLRAQLADLPGIVVASAGTMADDGAPMDVTAAVQSERLGGDPNDHRSRYLTERIVADADLILTAERAHRAAVVSLLPRASRRTFTILQFARVLRGLEPADLEAVTDLASLVTTVAAARGMVPPPADPADDDVEDPYRRSPEVHERVADVLAGAVGTITTAIHSTTAGGSRG
ncbi:low molecular weight phosphatase family protein [Curtobacterium sp. MCBD17_028]|uniref:arsenate reductase/protein-tyrosine-phosphatase family protein n=1 Tax=Curtobacterium sp. MCBD17_028 TaxID=2175670 RepID=UPI000DA6F313|nr:low molecular weight phosphatase family protein [Curtobacterium sp. MCBD17_028]PZE27904.1 low molecular weight phosphatase family protein [Curtobacterium sp. MCBD17_028]